MFVDSDFLFFYSFVRWFLLNVYFCFVLCCVECCLIILVHSFAGSWLIFAWINWNRSHVQWSTWTNVTGGKNKSITSTLARYSQNISMTINHSFASAFSISGFFMYIFCRTLPQKFNSGREKKRAQSTRQTNAKKMLITASICSLSKLKILNCFQMFLGSFFLPRSFARWIFVVVAVVVIVFWYCVLHFGDTGFCYFVVHVNCSMVDVGFFHR